MYISRYLNSFSIFKSSMPASCDMGYKNQHRSKNCSHHAIGDEELGELSRVEPTVPFRILATL